MNEEKLPAFFHNVYAETLTVFKRREDAPPEIIYRAEMAAPKPWVGLTDEEIIEWVASGEYNVITNDWASHIDFARAIELKVKEKNT